MVSGFIYKVDKGLLDPDTDTSFPTEEWNDSHFCKKCFYPDLEL